MPSKNAKLPTIAILLFPGVKLLDVTGPLQVFADARRDGEPAYHTALVSLTGGTISTDASIALPTVPLDTSVFYQSLDTLIVAGGRGVFEVAACAAHQETLTKQSKVVRRLASVCIGAFVLAAGGYFDGRSATTHWAYCEKLKKMHPAIDVRPDAIFVKDGSIWSSAGVSTGIDMALAMVESDLGAEEALRLARSLVLYIKRPGGQEQFSAPLAAQVEGAGTLGPVLAHIRTNVSERLDTVQLANLAGMSKRTFARRFQDEVGDSPGRYVERVRVDVACEAFNSGESSVKWVAQIAGFGSEERMRRAFQRNKGIAPSEYRDRFFG